MYIHDCIFTFVKECINVNDPRLMNQTLCEFINVNDPRLMNQTLCDVCAYIMPVSWLKLSLLYHVDYTQSAVMHVPVEQSSL